MKKRILTAFTVILTAVFTAGGLTACAPPHRYAENWSYNETEHWREITCIHKTMVDVQKEPHSFDGNFCTVCGYYRITEGLYYTANYGENEEVVSYTLSGMGSAIGYYVGVPEYYQGKPVTKIENAILRYADELVIPKTVTAIDTDNSYGNHDYSLTRINVASGNPVYASADGILYNKAKTEIIYIPRVSGSVTIPEGVTKIPNNAFRNCRELTDISLPNSVELVGSNAFSGCDALKYNVIDGGKYLGNSENPNAVLVEVEETDIFDIKQGTKIVAGSAFSGCGITKVTAHEGLKYIGNGAFSNCEYLEEAILPESLKVIESFAFNYCYSLKKINIPSGIEKLGEYAFDSCDSLEYFENDGVLYLGNENNNCVVLMSVPDKSIQSYTMQSGTKIIYSHAFSYCQNIRQITIPDSVTYIGNLAFFGCTALESIALSKNLTEIAANTFEGCGVLKSIDVPAAVTVIGKSAFRDCNGLEQISIPDGLTEIEITAFYNCSSLKSIALPATVKAIGQNAFLKCSSLESITLPFVGSDAERTSEYGSSMFGYIFGANDIYDNYIYVPETLVSVTVLGGKIGDVSFANCEYIRSVVLDGVTEIGHGAFVNCYNLTTVDLGKDVTFIGESAFRDCGSLEKIAIPEGVQSILGDTFSRCYSLNEITLPASLKTIMQNSFYDCGQVERIHYRGTVTQWQVIERDMYSGLNNGYTPIQCTDGETSYN